MTDFQRDMKRVRELAEDAVSSSIVLGAWTSGTELPPEKLQSLLERVSGEMERTTMAMRAICEKYSPGAGGYGQKRILPAQDVVGSVDRIGFSWLHIRLDTVLPHCRYQPPAWLSDTIRRLLEAYEAQGGTIPFFRGRTVLIVDEHSDIAGRHIFDQDNKGWKAVSNAMKGLVFPDDDQYDLAVILLSGRSSANVTHLTVMDLADVGEFMSMRAGYTEPCNVYSEF